MDPKGTPILPSLLPVLEAAARRVRSGDFAGGSAVLDRAASALGSRALDRGCRMILGKVLARLIRASREAGFSVPTLGLLGSALEAR
jgi:hypothetical protein